jgi:dipeptidase E
VRRRLALYSDQISRRTGLVDERVRAWLPANATIAYLPSSPDPDRLWFRAREAHYGRYAYSLRFFGLEHEFDPSASDALFACEAVHLAGGNTFRFLYWLRERGLIEPLRKYAAHGGVLIGVSAGAILMTRDIRTAFACGDALYPGVTDFEGLALVDFAVVPHYDEIVAARLAESVGRFDGPIYGIPDGSAIVVDSDQVDLMGAVVRITT